MTGDRRRAKVPCPFFLLCVGPAPDRGGLGLCNPGSRFQRGRFGLAASGIDRFKTELPPAWVLEVGHIYRTERVALFIDGANLFATAKALKVDIDFRRLLKYFRLKGHLVRALYYTALADEHEYSSLRSLMDWLAYNGFSVIEKPRKECLDTTGRRKVNGNMHVEMAVDAMRFSEHLDHIVLFSGDGEFRTLVAALQAKAKRVSVVSTLQTRPTMVADELRRQADQFIDLADLAEQVGRDFSRSN